MCSLLREAIVVLQSILCQLTQSSTSSSTSSAAQNLWHYSWMDPVLCSEYKLSTTVRLQSRQRETEHLSNISSDRRSTKNNNERKQYLKRTYTNDRVDCCSRPFEVDADLPFPFPVAADDLLLVLASTTSAFAAPRPPRDPRPHPGRRVDGSPRPRAEPPLDPRPRPRPRAGLPRVISLSLSSSSSREALRVSPGNKITTD